MKKISIIIVTYHSQRDILPCLESLFRCSDIDRDALEMIIVDNSPLAVFQETEALVREEHGSEIIIIHQPANGGYGQGNNAGIAMASARLICISNPDIVLTSAVFGKALELFAHDPVLAMVGGKQQGGPDYSFWIRPEYEFFVLTAPLQKLLNRLNLYYERYFFLSGAFLIIDKEKFLRIGTFNEDMFLYGEEADLTRRFLDQEYRTLYRKDFTYLHNMEDRPDDGGESLGRMLDSYRIYFHTHQLSFKAYLKRRIISSSLLVAAGTIAGLKNLRARNSRYLSIFRHQLEQL